MTSASAAAQASETFDTSKIPFDSDKLDKLMDAAGLDVLIVTSKHNIQYLLGGYRFFFFDAMDAIGVSRYLPIFIYPKGRPEDAAYIANSMESYERAHGRFWVPNIITKTWGTLDAMRLALDYIGKLERAPRKIGVEKAFLPADAYSLLESATTNAAISDCLFPLERLRAVKTPHELDLLRKASEGVIDSMLTVMASHGPGSTRHEMVAALKQEEVARGLSFDYCLITTGTSLNRAPSDEKWHKGDILSLDLGGNYHGYIGDLCRMAILGEPDLELQELLAEVDEIQQAARKPIRAGVTGGDIYTAAEKILNRSPNRAHMHFCAHGMGLVSHEAPRLTSNGPVPYDGDDAGEPLQAGMVISIETTMPHPKRGFVKLEDTVAVTATGWEGYGDTGRGWNEGKL